MTYSNSQHSAQALRSGRTSLWNVYYSHLHIKLFAGGSSFFGWFRRLNNKTHPINLYFNINMNWLPQFYGSHTILAFACFRFDRNYWRILMQLHVTKFGEIHEWIPRRWSMFTIKRWTKRMQKAWQKQSGLFNILIHTHLPLRTVKQYC